ncbi:uncharacterized protein LOC143854305 [Tasmannia lanceolata]|uniref:uncharacterized protein LOC143854305 n=1 Tax=Tasmannia lanceolata TaxID=3420 RepID=UPI004063BADF
MKKKTQKSSAALDLDLKTLVHQHSLFFDNLIELIPARFYLPVGDREKPWFQGLSKVGKASAKKESRENLKKARRARLDPEKSSTTVDLLKKSLENEKSEENASEDDEKEADLENPLPLIKEDRSVTYEELRHRLHRRIEELRTNRNAGSEDKPRIEKKREISRAKRKREFEEKKHKVRDFGGNSSFKPKSEQVVSEGLAFSHVRVGNEDEQMRKKKKVSKLQALEKAKRLAEEKKDPEKGEIVSKKHSWSSAVSRAAGIKVHDDPKLLKLSLKKDKKRHQKNVEKWKERVGNTMESRAKKQQTRAKNIDERIKQKKMRRIAKREKKLMRPGFEGRKEGFINET